MTLIAHKNDAFEGISSNQLALFISEWRDNVAVWKPVVDDFGAVVDGSLLWWNHSFERVRRNKLRVGTLLSEIYVHPIPGIAHLSLAWAEGSSFQTVTLTQEFISKYRGVEQLDGLLYWCRWQRVGDVVITTTPDLTEHRQIHELQNDTKSLLAVASRKRALAVDRERIARGLHDTVIQNLYATSLSLSMSLRKAHHEEAKAISSAIDSIADVIAEIRREIFNIESRHSSSLRLQIEDALIPILLPTDASLDLTIDAPELSDALNGHIRAVCTEGASNSVRHGGATALAVDVRAADGELSVTLSDNGCGVAPDAVNRNGLHNLRERAESLGGKMEMTSSSTAGTTIRWVIPTFLGGGVNDHGCNL